MVDICLKWVLLHCDVTLEWLKIIALDMKWKCHLACLYLNKVTIAYWLYRARNSSFVSHVQKGLIYYTQTPRRHV